MYDINIASYSERGSNRVNDDYILTQRINETYYFVVADGIRGYSCGGTAAEMACRKIMEKLTDYKTVPGEYKEILNSANEMLVEYYKEYSCKMGCSVCLMHIEDNKVHRAHVGDCRIYCFDKGKLSDVTYDHSIAREWAEIGYIHKDEIRFHKDRRKLTSALGLFDSIPKCDEEEIIELKPNQQFLLCTNGFWELITEDEMTASLIEASDAQEWLNNMIKYLRNYSDRKTKDNMSAIAIWVEK